jgi:hypothetical protein
MPFCPKCKSEYRAGVTHCADDGELLVDARPEDLDAVNLVEVYAAYRVIEADRISALLEDDGVPCFTRGLRRAGFPTGAGSEAPTRIAVPQEQAARAVELIEQARRDEIVSPDGAFLR